MLLLLQLLTCTYVQIFYWFKKIIILNCVMFIPFQATLYYMYANLTDLEIPVCKKSDDVPME